jgi:hypothetical protein
MALLDQVHQLTHDRLGGANVPGVAIEGEDVSAQKEVDLEVPPERPQDCVLGSGQLRGDRVVDRELPTRN